MTREELFVTTKLTQAHHRPELIEPSLRRSLANLYLVRAPIAYKYEESSGLWPTAADGSRVYLLRGHVSCQVHQFTAFFGLFV